VHMHTHTTQAHSHMRVRTHTHIHTHTHTHTHTYTHTQEAFIGSADVLLACQMQITWFPLGRRTAGMGATSPSVVMPVVVLAVLLSSLTSPSSAEEEAKTTARATPSRASPVTSTAADELWASHIGNTAEELVKTPSSCVPDRTVILTMSNGYHWWVCTCALCSCFRASHSLCICQVLTD